MRKGEHLTPARREAWLSPAQASCALCGCRRRHDSADGRLISPPRLAEQQELRHPPDAEPQHHCAERSPGGHAGLLNFPLLGPRRVLAHPVPQSRPTPALP